MISRRNIRIKVMQALYAAEKTDNNNVEEKANQILLSEIQEAHELWVHAVFFLYQLAQYAKIDAKQRASKNLPTAADLSVPTKIADANWCKKIMLNNSFINVLKKYKIEPKISNEVVKQIYHQLLKEPTYNNYNKNNDNNDDSDLFNFVFNDLMLANDTFVNYIHEHFNNWDDDAEMIKALVLSSISKPASINFQNFINDEKFNFAKELIQTVCDKKDYLLKIIEPKLKNWEVERVATIDIIILKMGICEFLYFDTIPVRVTINEYIDIAKAYSTTNSGQFINATLDTLMHDFKAENKINKRVYKNSIL